jgi:hypothetical protein
MDIQTIRGAICANRGGHSQTSDAGLSELWNSLPAETQKQYLDSVATTADLPDESPDDEGKFEKKKNRKLKIENGG